MDRPSPIVKCDGCNTYGRRREGYMTPEHWLYIESVVAHSASRRVHIVYACSEACASSMWQRGPGPNVVDERGTMRMRAKENAQATPTAEELEALRFVRGMLREDAEVVALVGQHPVVVRGCAAIDRLFGGGNG